MESGDLSEWSDPGGVNEGGGEFNDPGGDSQASQEIALGGEWSVKMTLTDGSGATRLFRWDEIRQNSSVYVTASFYFPRAHVAETFWNVFQFKSELDQRNDPFWILGIGERSSGSMYLYLYEWQESRKIEQELIDIPVDTWVTFSCYLRQSAVDDGHIKCWQDNLLLWDFEGVTTGFLNGANAWSVNHFADLLTPAPAVIYVDNAAVVAVDRAPDEPLVVTLANGGP